MRLIDADELEKLYAKRYGHNTLFNKHETARGWKEAIELLCVSPTIEPIHTPGICYCQECKYLTKITDGTFECGLFELADFGGTAFYPKPYDFCSKGERKDWRDDCLKFGVKYDGTICTKPNDACNNDGPNKTTGQEISNV